jgi:hypothetical protein
MNSKLNYGLDYGQVARGPGKTSRIDRFSGVIEDPPRGVGSRIALAAAVAPKCVTLTG